MMNKSNTCMDRKRVWLAEQGPDDGQLAGVFRWTQIGPTNHHGVQKILGYLMWGIVDENSEYIQQVLEALRIIELIDQMEVYQ